MSKLFKDGTIKIKKTNSSYGRKETPIFVVWKFEDGAWNYEYRVVANTYKEAFYNYEHGDGL